ncbi:MAG TPA: RNA degradosome polyphosphate kinase, partial [bacterium]|nr:RNA degradosome polyphosphate kinase [bacterium]
MKAKAKAKIKWDNCAYYINRELSWLEFNDRVLSLADDKNNKLLERLKFLAIVSSNLEEFFMVRVAAINQQKEDGLKVDTPDGLSFDEQLKMIRERVKKMLANQYDIFYNKLIPALKKYSIEIITKIKDLEKYEKYLFNIFENEIKPILTPISIGPTHPFPNLLTGRLYLAVALEPEPDCPELVKKSNLSFIEIPTNIQGRFIKIEKEQTYIPIEKIIELFVDDIYSGFKVKSKNIIKITRDADFDIDKDDVADLLKEVETNIKSMHQRDVIKLEYEKGLPTKILNTIIAKNKFKKKETFEIHGILNLNDLIELYNKIDSSELKDEQISPIIPTEFYDGNIFDQIKKKDFLFFHPYQSYQPIIDLINTAADDPNVLAIKQLLYRTSSNSPIINALIRAAENGKYVTVIVEVTARFDE